MVSPPRCCSDSRVLNKNHRSGPGWSTHYKCVCTDLLSARALTGNKPGSARNAALGLISSFSYDGSDICQERDWVVRYE